MTKKGNRLYPLAVLLLPVVLHATVWTVPDPYRQIQDGINAASNGDTVSVWGYGEPPFAYQENVDFGGKSVFLVNRSFLPEQTPGYDSSWEHVIIDARALGRVATLSLTMSWPAATLKGFSLANGRSNFEGGGVFVRGGHVRIIKNRFKGNTTQVVSPSDDNRGGGGLFWMPSQACTSGLLAYGNLFEDNEATYMFGGAMAVLVGYGAAYSDTVRVDSNLITGNRAVEGGGIYLHLALPENSLGPVEVCRNQVAGNTLLEAYRVQDSLRGGGILAQAWNLPLRRNLVEDNSDNGIWTEPLAGFGGAANLGTSDSPGWNVLRHNGQYDVVCTVDDATLDAVGNYWGSVDTRRVRARVVVNPLAGVRLDPIAASGKWFSIGGEQMCETGVIVTGDVCVEPDGSLTACPGTTWAFDPEADFAIPGYDPDLCDLVVASGGVMSALGEAGDSIRFTPRWPPPCGQWSGMQFEQGSAGTLRHCVISRAYVGVDARSQSEVEVSDCRVDSCDYVGVRAYGAFATVLSSRVGYNGVYGVSVEQVGAGTRATVAGNDFVSAGAAGVRVKGAAQDAWCAVQGNTVAPPLGQAEATYGILVENVSAGLSCEDNVCTGFHDAGIAAVASTFSASGSQVTGKTYAGFSLMNGSTPLVRSSTVRQCKLGILNDEMSLGDFGTRENPGLNSIPMDNTYWVCNRNTWHPLPAVNNWWGTPTPYEYLERFIGPVSYRPWLVEPPDGGQSAGATEERWPCFAVRPTLVRERCAIAWTVERAGNASVRIYDASGRVVTTLADRCMAPGRYSAVWDGHTTSGACVPNGVYVCRVESASGSRCSKVAVMR